MLLYRVLGLLDPLPQLVQGQVVGHGHGRRIQQERVSTSRGDVGAGISDMLTTALINTNHFIVYEVVSRVMCKSLCTGGIPLLKHLLQHLLHLREPL
ncbi:hypothetical protein CSW18_09225 [Thermus scotoductus]|nr:hypothetical protein CSW18_09225 [Thermus scotoductus]